MKLDLEAIEARCESATPGPWYAREDRRGYKMVLRPTNKFYAGPDCEFIACARTDIPALLAEVRQLQRELHDEQIRRDEWEKVYNRAIAGTEVERLRAELTSEHRLMIMYSDRDAAVRRKLREIGVMAPHEEITNLDAIERLPSTIKLLRAEIAYLVHGDEET